jgi:hypothetical protein
MVFTAQVEANKAELAEVLAIDLNPHNYATKYATAVPTSSVFSTGVTARANASNVGAVYDYAAANYPAETLQRSVTTEYDHMTANTRAATAIPPQVATQSFTMASPYAVRSHSRIGVGTAPVGGMAGSSGPRDGESSDDDEGAADFLLPQGSDGGLNATGTLKLPTSAPPLADTVPVVRRCLLLVMCFFCC